MEKNKFLEKAKAYSDEKYPKFWDVITRNRIDHFLEQDEINKTTPEEWVEKQFNDYNDYLSMPEPE